MMAPGTSTLVGYTLLRIYASLSDARRIKKAISKTNFRGVVMVSATALLYT